MTKTGVVQRISLEGGLLALVTDAGESFELLGLRPELTAGVRAEVELDVRGADVSIGMMGRPARVKRFKLLP